MKRDEVFKIMNEIFRDIFNDVNIEVVENTSSRDIEDWDSLEHINLIVAIEKKFKIKFEISEVSKMKNVGEMVDVIVSRKENIRS